MTLGEELTKRYTEHVCNPEKYSEEIDRLKGTLFEEALSTNEYLACTSAYPLLMSNRRFFEKWLNENGLDFASTGYGNTICQLEIKW